FNASRWRSNSQWNCDMTHLVNKPATVERLESRRLLSAGDVDPTFGDGGLVSLQAAPGGTALQSVAPCRDGKSFIVVGMLAPPERGLVMRVDGSGRPDPSFGGGDGRVE